MRVINARSGQWGLARLWPSLVDTTTTEAAPPFAVFEGWEARTAISPRHADFELRLLLLVSLTPGLLLRRRNVDNCSSATSGVRGPTPASRDFCACSGVFPPVCARSARRSRRSGVAKCGLRRGRCQTETPGDCLDGCASGGEASRATCMTVDGFLRSGSLTSRWMCSGMTT